MNDDEEIFHAPKEGSLERIFLEKIANSENGVTFLDFVGTGITEDNIDQIVRNLEYGLYATEDDDKIQKDS
jgi:hypothetical protein